MLKYRQLFTDEQVIVASSWVAKTEVAPTIPPKGNDSIDYNTIVGLLTDEELVIFFSFFYLETNGEKTPFLPQKDVQALLKNGFSLSSMPKPQFKLELDGSKSAGIIYYCIHSLYDKHGRTRNDKKFIAQFFYDNFKNFSKITFDNFMNSINPTKPKTMTFDLFENGYLKD